MVKVRVIALAILASCLVLVPELPAQSGDLVIRTETREVQLEVTVTDKQGRTPRDLTANDFSVLEDEKKQIINSVSLGEANPQLSRQHLVLYFDERGLSQAMAQEAARFIEAVAAPDCYMAIMSFGRYGAQVHQDFTNDKRLLKRAIPGSMSNATVGRGPDAMADSVNLIFLESLKRVAQSLGRAPGRKALVIFAATGWASGGGSSSFWNSTMTADNRNVRDSASTSAPSGLDEFISISNKANVAVYAGDENMAKATGGAYFRPGSGVEKLTAIFNELESNYLLTYTPPDSRDEACHSLRVTINRRGFEARARKEYCTEKALDLVAGRVAGADLAASNARDASANASVTLPFFFTKANRAEVHLTLELIPGGMKFQKGNGKLSGQIDLLGVLSRTDGGVAARFTDSVKVEFNNQAQVDEFVRKPYRYENQLAVNSGDYTFRLTFKLADGAISSVERKLSIQPWSGSDFSIASIALSRDASYSGSAPDIEVPLLEGLSPLRAIGKKFAPAGTNRFTHADAIYFYTQIYDPRLATPAATRVHSLQFRVLDRGTGEQIFNAGPAGIEGFVTTGNQVIPFATALPLQQLPPGSYKLEVIAGLAGGPERAVSTVDFLLE